MAEQKLYQQILSNIIDQVNNHQLVTSQQVLDVLIGELSKNDQFVKRYVRTKDQISGS